MKTKEEILNTLSQNDNNPIAAARTYIEDYAGGNEAYYRDNIVTTAMDVYAKEESINFLVFVTSRYTQAGSIWKDDKGNQVLLSQKLWEEYQQEKSF